MKIILVFFMLMLHFATQASIVLSAVDSRDVVKQNLAKGGALIGISASQYKSASDKLLLVISGDITPEMAMLNDIHEATNPDLYSEKEIIAKLNSQRSEFASFLGVPVEKLDVFLTSVTENVDVAKVKDYRIGTNGDQTEVEIISVKCAGPCGSFSNQSSFNLLVMVAAENAGIGQYTLFRVQFINGDNTNYSTVQTWRYNNFSGAWRVRERERPCPTCPFN